MCLFYVNVVFARTTEDCNNEKFSIKKGKWMGCTIWAHLDHIFKSEVNGPELRVSEFESWFHFAADVTRILKWEAPEHVAPMNALGLPRHGKGWGACDLCPDGVPHPKHIHGAITVGSIRELLADVSGSEAAKSISISRTP